MRSWVWVTGVLVITAALLGVWLWGSGDGMDERRGIQVRSPVVSIGDAESRPWSVLENEAGESRPDFPRPLIAQDSLLCFGFERLDFDSPIRPSLARCVEREGLQNLADDSIVSVFVIKAGLDTWHVIASGARLDTIDISAVDKAELPAERIFIGDGVIALRLPNDIRIETMAWTLGRSRYLCEPAPDAASSGIFCA